MKKVVEVAMEVALGLLFLVGFISFLASLWFILNLLGYSESGIKGPTLVFFEYHPQLLALMLLLSPFAYLSFWRRVRENVLWRAFGRVCEFLF